MAEYFPQVGDYCGLVRAVALEAASGRKEDSICLTSDFFFIHLGRFSRVGNRVTCPFFPGAFKLALMDLYDAWE
jgi:hypothetical protein